MDATYRTCSVPGCSAVCMSAVGSHCPQHAPGMVQIGGGPPPPPRQISQGGAASKSAQLVKWIPYPSNLQELLSMPLHFGSLDYFVEFSQSEYSAENISFWRACQQFKISHHHPQLKAYWRSATATLHAEAAEKGPLRQVRIENDAAATGAASGRDSPQLERPSSTPASASDLDTSMQIEPYRDTDLQLGMCSNARDIFCKYLIADAEFEVRFVSWILCRA
jgi:hypothetical protein